MDQKGLMGECSIITPQEPEARGCQLSILCGEGGKAIFEHLTANGVIADWREPDVIRIAPVPMYNSFTDVLNFTKLFEEAVRN